MSEFIKRAENETAKECAKRNGLDMRGRYAFCEDKLVRCASVMMVCYECNGDGCHECGFHGKKKFVYPEFQLIKK